MYLTNTTITHYEVRFEALLSIQAYTHIFKLVHTHKLTELIAWNPLFPNKSQKHTIVIDHRYSSKIDRHNFVGTKLNTDAHKRTSTIPLRSDCMRNKRDTHFIFGVIYSLIIILDYWSNLSNIGKVRRRATGACVKTKVSKMIEVKEIGR